MTKLNEDQIAVYLGKLPGWKYEKGALTKTYAFQKYRDGVGFMQKIADLAEKEHHHPDLTLSYRHVTVTLTTFKAHGVTGKDFLLAEQIEQRFR